MWPLNDLPFPLHWVLCLMKFTRFSSPSSLTKDGEVPSVCGDMFHSQGSEIWNMYGLLEIFWDILLQKRYRHEWHHPFCGNRPLFWRFVVSECDVKVKWTQHSNHWKFKKCYEFFARNKVICKVHRLGDKNDQFCHVRYLMQDSNFM